jgi:plasmid stabilization system protein ParE
MTGFAFHPDALADMEEIWECIAADNQEAADRVVAEIYDTVSTLARFPLSATVAGESAKSVR